MKVQVISYLYDYEDMVSIGPLYYFLRSFCDSVDPNNKIEWFDPIHKWAKEPMTQEEAEECAQSIAVRNPDVILVSMYVWTEENMTFVCEKLKKINKSIKIIGGGPNIDATHLSKNFQTYPFFDAVIYGDGEEAFYGLYERYKDTKEITAGLNCATRDDKGYYKRFKYENYKPYKTYTHETVKSQLIKQIKEFTKTSRRVLLPYETDRGCPYTCAFCDWSSGLHHKITIRNTDIIKEEVDDLNSIREYVRLQVVNANYGLIKHDAELLSYMFSKDLSVRIVNWSKTKKDVVFSLVKKHIKHDQSFKHRTDYSPRRFAIQSIYKEVREAIARPDIDWESYKELIEDIIQNHDPNVNVEIISDLPLMTPLRYVEQIIEISKLKVKSINYYPWTLLTNSPAAKDGWLSERGYTAKKLYHVVSGDGNILLENFIFGKDDITMKLFLSFIHGYFNIYNGDLSLLYKRLDVLYALAVKFTKQMEKYEKETGKFIWGAKVEGKWLGFQDILAKIVNPLLNTSSVVKSETNYKYREEMINVLKTLN